MAVTGPDFTPGDQAADMAMPVPSLATAIHAATTRPLEPVPVITR